MADASSAPSERQIRLAAIELASQERYNPAWCKPGQPVTDIEHYRMRARLILEAAMHRG